MNDEPDPRIDAVAKALGISDYFSKTAIAAADASDAERGIVRVQQADIDNDRARIAAAERAGREIREALGLSSMADWSAVLRAVSVVRNGWSVGFYKTADGMWAAFGPDGWITGAWPTIVEAAAAIKSRVG